MKYVTKIKLHRQHEHQASHKIFPAFQKLYSLTCYFKNKYSFCSKHAFGKNNNIKSHVNCFQHIVIQENFEIFYFCIHIQELNNDTDKTGKVRPFQTHWTMKILLIFDFFYRNVFTVKAKEVWNPQNIFSRKKILFQLTYQNLK